MIKRTVNFNTLHELCDYVRKNDIDVYSEDIKCLCEYVFGPSRTACVCYAPVLASPPRYTIQYEDHTANVGSLDSHYVEDFSES